MLRMVYPTSSAPEMPAYFPSRNSGRLTGLEITVRTVKEWISLVMTLVALKTLASSPYNSSDANSTSIMILLSLPDSSEKAASAGPNNTSQISPIPINTKKIGWRIVSVNAFPAMAKNF